MQLPIEVSCPAVDVADPTLIAAPKVLEGDLSLDLEAGPSSRFGDEERGTMYSVPVSQAQAQGHDLLRDLNLEAAGTSRQHAETLRSPRPDSAPARTVIFVLGTCIQHVQIRELQQGLESTLDAGVLLVHAHLKSKDHHESTTSY